MRLELGLLGTISARVDGRALDLGHPKQQWVLAALLADANRAVSLDQLTYRVWGERQPHSARATLRTYMSRLRTVLANATTDCSVRHEGAGYLVAVDEAAIDLHGFRRLLAQARTCVDPGDAVERYQQALDRWRGDEALAGMDTPWADAFRTTLHAERFAARLELYEALLDRGEHTALLPELTALATQHPLDEALAGQLILALYRSGRQADALAHYDRMRRRLADELGVDPGPELQQLHRQILRADQRLGPPAASPRVIPVQLPADSGVFTGRRTELDGILSLRPDHGSATLVISAIDGMAGVGKTALAVHAAHRLAPAFPDGQLFLDLHGHTHGVEPMEPLAALEVTLRALGVPGERIPPGLDERAALYRTHLDGTRTLIVLDNAYSEHQVTPLLPAAPGCFVIVTSRQRLFGLDDARRVSLDVLPLADAVALFTNAADRAQVAAETSGHLAEIVELCGRLPLALRIAAARLNSRSAWTLAHLAERLADHQGVTELQAGQRSVTAALDLSYRHLTPAQQRTYRLLSLHPGSDTDVYAAAALTGTAVRQTVGLLDHLVDANLLAEPLPGRYRFHDLVRAHATTAAAVEDTDAARRRALDGLLRHYAHTASVAMDAVYPHETEQRPATPPVTTPVPAFAAPRQAGSWLDAELDNLLATAGHAAAHGSPGHTLHLSAALHRHLRTRGRHDEAVVLHEHALRLAATARDPAGELATLNRLGDMHYMRDRNEEAAGCFERALDLARTTGDREGEQNALTGLGHINRHRGEYQRAAECFERALDLARTTSNRSGEGYALYGLGHVRSKLGSYERAAECFERALDLARTTGDPSGERDALSAFGHVHGHLGRYERAAECFERALELARATGDRSGEGYALYGLGHVRGMLGSYERAAECFERALDLARTTRNLHGEMYARHGLGDARRMLGQYAPAAEHYGRLLELARAAGDRNGQFEGHEGLGRCHHATGDHPDALARHRSALTLATELGQLDDECRAHDGLARVHHALGDHEKAREHWRTALAVLTRHGSEHTWDPQVTAGALRARLDAL
ncbi:tetratricopeptide repeat protein [Streptomyces sp. B6B3]|uniref:AfsR/SARP family transcriptional regulator n=1 Tax=Streptomyces sp. B6B3 TaxID=3153570 RepID=UPI00325E6124